MANPRFISAEKVTTGPVPIPVELEFGPAGGLQLVAYRPTDGQKLILFAIYMDGSCERWAGLGSLAEYGLSIDEKDNDRIRERT